MTFDNYLALFAVIAFLAGLFTFMYIDLRKEWKRKKREDIRREQLIDYVSVISAYCFYKGIASGYAMERSIDDILLDRIERNHCNK